MSVLSYQPSGFEELPDANAISDVVGRDQRLLWVDLSDPTDDDFACVQEEFSLHHLAIEDARTHGQRPKLEHYPTHAFVVAYSADLAEVDLFVGPTWLVSVRGRSDEGAQWSPAAARRRFERTKPERASVGFLLHSVLDELVDGYFTRLERIEDELEDVEDVVFAERLPPHELQQRLFGIRRRLLLFRRAVVPLRDVVAALLRREVAWVDEQAVVLLRDVHDHLLLAVDLIDDQRELLGNAVEAHLAILSNRMNQVMKKMTSWGAILLGSTLVAGIYGMNFEHMPELGWRLGYPFALGVMVTITLLGYRAFRRRDWL